jgi:hypothetical protein
MSGARLNTGGGVACHSAPFKGTANVRCHPTFCHNLLQTLLTIMSFGFSVGDFVAVGKLVNDIVSSLQSVGGAKSEYQELVREFQSLYAALHHLDQLEIRASDPSKVQMIKCAALSCRYPLEHFLAKMRKYEASLGPWCQSKVCKTATDKLRWTFGEKHEIRQIQTHLNIHIGTINMMLTEHGLERMDLQERRSEANALQIRHDLEKTHRRLGDIQKDFTGQVVVLRTMHTMLGNLCSMISREMKTTLKQLFQAVNIVW